MGQNPNRNSSEHPNPTTKIGSKMAGNSPTNQKWDPKTVLTHSPWSFHFVVEFALLRDSLKAKSTSWMVKFHFSSSSVIAEAPGRVAECFCRADAARPGPGGRSQTR